MREAGLSVQVSRSVRVPAAVVRAALTRALRDAGFDIVSEHVTLVQGRRGSQLAGAVVKDKLPVQVELRFGGEGDGCRLDVDLRDRWRTPAGRVYGLQSQYEHVFAAVLTGLDAVLAELAPDTAGLGTGWSGQGEGAQSVLDRANASLSRATSNLVAAADRGLQGKRESTPTAWEQVHAVRVDLPGSPLLLARGEVEAMLGVAALISRRPGKLPPKLVEHVERLAAAIEPLMSSGVAVPLVELTAADGPGVEFLRQQAAVREALPARRMLVCRDCRFEKVINEDYKRITDRNRKLSAIVGGLGATIRPGSISPFVMIGQLMRAKNLDPEFVCPRCQGLDADPYAITFCPSCGARHTEAALRTCSCGFDFRAEGVKRVAARPPVAEIDPPARPPAITPPAALPPAPAPPAAPAPADDASLPPRPPMPGARLRQTPPATPVPAAPTAATSPKPAPPPVPMPPMPTTPIPPLAPRPQAPPPPPVEAPGWYADPWRQAAWRWWDGRVWTGRTAP